MILNPDIFFSIITQSFRVILFQCLIFFSGSFALQEAISSSSNYYEANNVLDVTKESLENITILNKSAIVLFFSER